MNRYTLVFGPSRSRRYAQAVKLARALHGYTETADGHSVALDAHFPEVLDELLAIVQGWQSTELLANGHPLGRQAIWAVVRMLRCQGGRDLSELDELWCRGFPGHPGRVPCRLIDADLPYSDEPEYHEDGTFRRLLSAHERQIFADACPHYDREAVVRVWAEGGRNAHHTLELLSPGKEG